MSLHLVLWQTVVYDGVEDGLVGAHPVVHLAPPLPLVLRLELDAGALDPEPDQSDLSIGATVDQSGASITIPDQSPDAVLVRDVVLREERVGLLLVELDGDVPGLVAVDLVQLAGVRTVHAHQTLQLGPGDSLVCFRAVNEPS